MKPTKKQKPNIKKAIMIISYYLVIILTPASLLAYISWQTATFILNPVKMYDIVAVNIPNNKISQEAGEPDIMAWVLNEWDKVGAKDRINAVITCESGWDVNRLHINNNNTVDLGLYQWNSLHLSSGLITLKCAGDYKCATQKAIELYKDKKFQPWVCAKLLNIK